MGLPTKVEICRSFESGNCTRDSCKFAHLQTGQVVERSGGEVETCADFLLNRCTRDHNCRFFHPPEDWIKNSKAARAFQVCENWLNKACEDEDCKLAHPAPEVQIKNLCVVVCQDFLRNACEEGDLCLQYHPTDLDTFLSANRFNQEDQVDSPRTVVRERRKRLGRVPRAELNPDVQEMQQVCFDFKRGKCTRGASCKFIHSGGEQEDKEMNADRRDTAAQSMRCTFAGLAGKGKFGETGSGRSRFTPLNLQLCGDFKRGACTRDDCKFLHMSRDLAETEGYVFEGMHIVGRNEGRNEERRRSRTPRRNTMERDFAPRQTCGDFQRGVCNRGASCKFEHIDDREKCGDFRRGVCNRGDSCRFSHATDTGFDFKPVGRDGFRRERTPPRASRRDAREKCGDFKRGVCNRGDGCKFSHEGLDDDFAPRREVFNRERSSPRRSQDWRETREKCGDFKRGVCSRGDSCKFSHETEDEAPVGVPRGNPDPRLRPMDSSRRVEFNTRPTEFNATEKCADFRLGRCTRGAGCRFEHVV